MPLAKGTPSKTPENPTLSFDLSEQADLANIIFPSTMPTWIQGKVLASEEVQNAGHPAGDPSPAAPEVQLDESLDEDVPF